MAANQDWQKNFYQEVDKSRHQASSSCLAFVLIFLIILAVASYYLAKKFGLI